MCSYCEHLLSPKMAILRGFVKFPSLVLNTYIFKQPDMHFLKLDSLCFAQNTENIGNAALLRLSFSLPRARNTYSGLSSPIIAALRFGFLMFVRGKDRLALVCVLRLFLPFINPSRKNKVGFFLFLQRLRRLIPRSRKEKRLAAKHPLFSVFYVMERIRRIFCILCFLKFLRSFVSIKSLILIFITLNK